MLFLLSRMSAPAGVPRVSPPPRLKQRLGLPRGSAGAPLSPQAARTDASFTPEPGRPARRADLHPGPGPPGRPGGRLPKLRTPADRMRQPSLLRVAGTLETQVQPTSTRMLRHSHGAEASPRPP